MTCKSCNGTGKVNDADLGDISYAEWDCPDCTSAAPAENLKALIDGQAVIIQELADQLAILRTGVIYMMMQASADEVDQTFEGNPWLKMKRDFVRMMNPSIRRLNALLGIKEPDRPDPPKIAVVTK